jgi:hypothetical protein
MALIPAGFGSGAGWNGGTFSAVALAPDGAVGAPAYAFSGQPATGIWRSGNGLIAFSSNGFLAGTVAGAGGSRGRLMMGGTVAYGTLTSPTYSYDIDSTTGFYMPEAAIQAAVISGVTKGSWSVSGYSAVGTMDLRSNTAILSLDTRANDSGMTTGQFRLVFQASGISLMYSSGKSVYVVAQSSQSGAQG